MAKEPEKKSIYAHRLKDVNKDGKRNFKDTWLGDALGFDGKIGTQGPGLGASLKGARREMGGDTAPKSTGPTSRPNNAPKKQPAASVGGKSLVGKVKPKSTGPTSRPNNKPKATTGDHNAARAAAMVGIGTAMVGAAAVAAAKDNAKPRQAPPGDNKKGNVKSTASRPSTDKPKLSGSQWNNPSNPKAPQYQTGPGIKAKPAALPTSPKAAPTPKSSGRGAFSSTRIQGAAFGPFAEELNRRGGGSFKRSKLPTRE